MSTLKQSLRTETINKFNYETHNLTDLKFKPVSLKICESQVITNVDRIPAVKQLCQHIQFHQIAHNQSVYMSDESFSKS